jgi:hypothetical protein
MSDGGREPPPVPVSGRPGNGAPEDAGVLAAVVAAAEPSLREHALPQAPEDRFAGRFAPGSTRGFVVEAIHEGWLMHYAEPRAFAGMDDDLRLLGGDALFALGLERLAAEADLEAVGEFADLISLTAQAVAKARFDWADALWEASVARLATPGAEGGAAAAFVSLTSENRQPDASDRFARDATPYP